MSKTITSEVLVDYSKCPRKAYLLLCTRKRGTQHEYMGILEQQRQAIHHHFVDNLLYENADVQLYSPDNLKGKHDFLINATLEVNRLSAKCAVLSKVRTHSTLGRYSYEPTIVVSSRSVKMEHRLEIFYVSYVLEQLQDKLPISGRIVGLDGKTHRVKLENGPKTFIQFLEPLQEWAAEDSPEPPSLILNKHCPTCQFHDMCREKAVHEDNLSLLDSISTKKAINSYEKKGLFTVNQLSYTFKQRKRRKHVKNPPPVIHKSELQALAIREGKIYLQELPELSRRPVELFLDIEGIPDQKFYYLIGLMIFENNATTYCPFWADTPKDEGQIWQQFLNEANQNPDAPIYHYGSFEPRTIAKLARRYDTDVEDLINRLVNINKHVYGKVYFPVYSNRLKEIGTFIGATWTSPGASGLQSLVWRYHWDETRSIEYKDLLSTYNQEDCRAIKLLIDTLHRISDRTDAVSDLTPPNQPKQYATKTDNPVHHQLESILKFAHSDYDKRKIKFRQMITDKGVENEPNMPKVLGPRRKKYRRLTKTVQLSHRDTCPNCENESLKESKVTTENIVVDLVRIKNGIKKTVIKYWAAKSYCRNCGRRYNPPGFNVHGCPPLYGRGFKVWIVYQRVVLRLPYGIIRQTIDDLFDEQIHDKLILNYIRDIGQEYLETEKLLIQYLLESPLIHADETVINIQSANWYVWVFTDGKHVIFKLKDTRKVEFVHELLDDYEGVLISDFYPGYDSLKCKQQKCWVHLIRDMNNDLWRAPHDVEYNEFVLEVKNLIVPILIAIDKYGLRKRNLNKYKRQIEKFYIKIITGKYYKSELVNKYQKRFVKYRESLFTFLEDNGIPWHNNTAEIAIRHIAVQRKISQRFTETITHNYLRLLSIRQSCRFQEKSFFQFLFSVEKDIDEFNVGKRRRHV